MIKKENVFEIGQLLKPHGIKGEITFSFINDVFEEKNCPFFILELEGILVPFFIENYRLKNNDTGLIKFENIDSEKQAQELSNAPIYLPNEYYQENNEEFDIHYFTGYTVTDDSCGELGKIVAVEDSTENVLFIIAHKNNELLIPAVDEFIVSIDEQKRLIHMKLPIGLVDMTLAEEE